MTQGKSKTPNVVGYDVDGGDKKAARRKGRDGKRKM